VQFENCCFALLLSVHSIRFLFLISLTYIWFFTFIPSYVKTLFAIPEITGSKVDSETDNPDRFTWISATAFQVNTVRISGESPCGGVVGSGAVQGESVLVGGLKGCYWWKTSSS
jgi:hypothetical protein